MTLFNPRHYQRVFYDILSFYPDCEAMASVIILLNVDPPTEIAVPGQHSVRIKSLDNVNRAINSNRQQPPRYEKDQDLNNDIKIDS